MACQSMIIIGSYYTLASDITRIRLEAISYVQPIEYVYTFFLKNGSKYDSHRFSSKTDAEAWFNEEVGTKIDAIHGISNLNKLEQELAEIKQMIMYLPPVQGSEYQDADKEFHILS